MIIRYLKQIYKKSKNMKKLFISSLILFIYAIGYGQNQQAAKPAAPKPVDPKKMNPEMTEIWDPEVKIIQPGSKDGDPTQSFYLMVPM